jgi:hypothetical protein
MSDVKETNHDPSELQIALDNREFEIQMFWQRSNYFLVLITALGVGAFTIEQEAFSLLLAVFAAISSFYWYRTNLGSKFWQESWEVEVMLLARRMNIASFERSTEDIVKQVSKSLARGWAPKKKSWLRRCIDRQIVSKPSVSYYMIMLSITSTVIWVIVSMAYAADLATSMF